MKNLLMVSCTALLAGCASPSISQYDKFEKVQVDRMVDNEVRSSIFSRSIVCLNALREESWPAPMTNQVISFVTNSVVTSVTNLTVTTGSNEHRASQTNTFAAVSQAQPRIETLSNSEEIPSEPKSPLDSGSDGETLSTSSTESLSTAPNQSVLSKNYQKVVLLSAQMLVNTGTNSLTLGTNQTITIETNMIITTVTNQLVTTVTNTKILSPEKPVHSYYLFTEISPADFTVQSGESLVLLVDGQRYSFASGQPQTSIKPRQGFLTTFYKVPGEVVVDIANAKKVAIRIKGTSGLIERSLSRASRNNFRDFLIKRFGNDAPETANLQEKNAKS